MFLEQVLKGSARLLGIYQHDEQDAYSTGYPLTSYTGYPLTGYLLTGYLITGYILTGYLLTGYLLTSYVLTGYLLRHVFDFDLFCTH